VFPTERWQCCRVRLSIGVAIGVLRRAFGCGAHDIRDRIVTENAVAHT